MVQFLKVSTIMFLCSLACNADAGDKNVEKKEVEKVTVNKGIVYEKYEKAIQESKESALFGKFAISGNAMAFAGTKNVENHGQLYGFLEAKGDTVFDNTLEGAVVTDGEGNGIASTAFSSFANKKGEVDRKIPELINTGTISGGADLQGGDAEVHGSVEGTATGNGVALYALADYGLILGSDGAGGSIDSDDSGKSDEKAGASKVKAKVKHKENKYKDKHKEDRKSKDKYKDKYKEKYKKDKHKEDKKKDSKSKSKNYAGSSEDLDFGKSNIDGSAGASTGGGSNASGGVSPETVPKIDKSDITGKSAMIAIEKLTNYSQISGNVFAKTSEGYIRLKSSEMNGAKVPEHIQPQWRSLVLSSSGNGVAAHTFVTSPTRQNFSTEAKNQVSVENVKNSGNIEGKAEFIAGNTATVNYTSAFAVANGISLSAYSDNNVGHYTATKMNEVENKGKISGNLKQSAGENTGSGWHEYSDATAVASGNGISLFSRSSNAKNKMTEATVQHIKNEGIISGELDSRAGFGNGQSINSTKSSGNGIAVYAQGGSQNDTVVNSISNKGMITGKAIIYGGKDTAAAYSGKEEKRFYVETVDKKKGMFPQEDLKYSFTKEEIDKGTEVFEKKIAEKNKKIDAKLEEFKEILRDSKEEYTKLKAEMLKKTELLEKASVSYIKKLESDVKDLEAKIAGKKELMKWHQNKQSYQKEIEDLQKEIEKKKGEQTNCQTHQWDKVDVEKVLGFYDDKITEWEEKLDQKVEEKAKALSKNEGELKEIEKEIDRVSKISYYINKEKKLKELEVQKKAKEEENKKEEDKINEKFMSAKKEIDAEIEKLKQDLKDEDVQEFLTIMDRRNLSETTVRHLEELKKENEKQKNPMEKETSHAKNTIHTEVYVYSSGNGISINQEGTKKEDKDSLKNFENEGVISGYTEIYRGNSNQEYSRVGYRSSGAGLSIKGKMKEEVKNAGILSGNEFALLSEGTKNNSYSISNAEYESGFAKLSNYGILAGRVIVGGYTGKSGSEQEYEYFETKDSKKVEHKNHGLYLLLNEKGEVDSVLKGKEVAKYKDKEIINLEEKEDTHKVNGSKVENKVVNGVGEKAVISTEKNVTIDHSIVNGFYKAIQVGDNSHATIRDSIINANGFGNLSYAVVGTDGNNELTVEKNAIINGRVDLGKGNDKLNVAGGKVLSQVDLGEGKNTLAFKAKETVVKDETEDAEIFQGEVKNASHLEVERDIKISEMAKISGIEKLNISKDKKLMYALKNKEKQAFYDFKNKEEEIGVVTLEGEGDFLLDDDAMGYSKAGDSKDILAWELRRNGNRVYLESEKIRTARENLGMNLSELQEISEGKEIKLHDTQKVLSNIYRNPRSAYSYATASTVSSYYTLLADTEKFIPKGKWDALVKAWKVENSDTGYTTKFSGNVVKVNYGLSDHINLGVNIGNGKQKIHGKSSSLKRDTILTGMELLWKKNHFSWNNGIAYGKFDTKEGADASVSAVFSSSKYEIPLTKTWSLVPQASVLFARMSQKEDKQQITNAQGKKIGEIHIPNKTQDYMEWDLELSLGNQTKIGQHQFHFDMGMEYTMSKDLDDTKVKQTENLAGAILKNEWKWKSPQAGNSWTGFTGLRYEHENGVSVDLQLRRNNKNMKNSSLGIGYLF